MNLTRREWVSLCVSWAGCRAASGDVPKQEKERAHLLIGHRQSVSSIAYSRDGKRLATSAGRFDKGVSEGEVKLWDPVTGKLLERLGVFASPAGNVSFSPDGNTLACCSRGTGGAIHLWDLVAGKHRNPFNPPRKNSDLANLFFSPDGRILARCAHFRKHRS